MSKKPRDTDDDYVDPDLAAQAELQKKYEAEALATPKDTAVPEGYVEPYEGMPARFFTGGATADEKAAWIEANGGVDPTQPTGEVAPGDADVKPEDPDAPTE
jgi:hypothetical protein